ncbi:UDP-N-acetylglucosamine 1-carboxyvinyltransferase [Pseudomonas stutzeri]|uniref:UDP-N-acetylglucosamine 1-carboxyvinyltransferase n=1 Tax=Stutzerimonas stutzeri TaxID=316 RepID=UPI00210C72CC|nr:UDP-N-acetylglucosamine 1-carboxyvinyltransferase [Stutzerimonas stutzeri]
MEKLFIETSKLEGVVNVSGAKNSVLKLLTCSILTEDLVELENFPGTLSDAEIHLQMLRILGKECVVVEDTVRIKENSILANELIWTDRSIRNTLLILGALVARFGYGKVPLPGGCKLGDRAYDLHVHVLQELGATVWEDDDYLYAQAPKKGLIGADIHLVIRSTGATENAIIAGTLASGKTTIWNPHIRPEIIDMVNVLNKMGALIRVYGQERIEVVGVERLRGVTHTVMPDNMEAITWLVGAVITRGDVEIRNFPAKDLEVALIHLKESGVKLYVESNSVIVRGGCPYPLEISTGPHPGINSDVQPIFAAFAACAKGQSTIVDLRFAGRYGYVVEMAKMGLAYEIVGNALKIHGSGDQLSGAKVKATDLRAGAALSLCGLTASGVTEISDAWQIERGYDRFVEKLLRLNATVRYE